MVMQTRRCRTCDSRRNIGHFRLMGGGNRSWTCRSCENDEAGGGLRRVVGDGGAGQVGPLSAHVPVRLVPSCTSCGLLEDLVTATSMPPELVEASRLGELLIVASVHRGCGRVDVSARVEEGRVAS